MACTIDIEDLTRKFISNRPWFKTKDYTYIFITESPKEKINDNNLMTVAKRYAQEWNENLMEIIPELKSGIYYHRMEFDDDSGQFLPAIRVFVADDVKLQLQEASKRIIQERELNEKNILEEQAREVQREDAKRAGVEYTKEYLSNRSRIEVADFVKLPEIRDVRAKWFNGKTSISIKEFLTTVKENHPVYDKLVKYLLKNLSNDTEIQLVDFIAGKDGVITHGLYSPNDNKIKLSETSLNRKQSAIGTVLHEILHAQTYHALQNNPELRTKINDKIAYIKTQLNIGEDYYGLTNADEFVASLFTNSRFAKRLQEIPATNKTSISLFDQILQMFFEFLGFVKGTSVYLEAAKLVTEVIEKQYQETLEFENALEAQGYEAADMFDRMITNNNVQYTFRAVNILQSDRAKQIFDKGNKNKWSLDKILTELAIPKEQKALLLDLGITDREQLIIDLVSKYGYTVEIKTAKDKKNGDFVISDDLGYPNEFSDSRYHEIGKPTQYYSNLTVPGGINYTENEISTPLIIPSIKGHAQFSTDKGIGWFRSDEQVLEGDNKVEVKDYTAYLYGDDSQAYLKTEGGNKTKTRRVLEIQSDLFQKGRDKENLVTQQREFIENREVVLNNGEEYDIKDFPYLVIDKRFGAVVKPVFTKEDGETFIKEELNTLKQPTEIKENQFLQLLNKDNNWVTFFIKSIIQDSAKRGYEKVLFPKGETAAKIEGHETIADEIRRIDNELLKYNDISKVNIKPYTKTSAIYNKQLEGINVGYIGDIFFYKKDNFTNLTLEEAKIEFNRVKNNLEQQKANLKSQGIEKLKPIEAFYEIKVGNILEKQFGKDNVKTITDEYGNQWREITITEDMQDTILFDRTNDNIKEGVSKLFESNPELANIGTQEQYSKYLDTIFPDYINNFAYEAVEEFLVANKIIDRKC
ncbi:MAG TPA: hypothetical protein PLV83_02010 [Bacilli bacterium]|nr:hypothetical protein [Bacilli bacterium]